MASTSMNDPDDEIGQADREEVILQITATQTSLEMLVRQIDSTHRGCGVWPEIRRTLHRLDQLRGELRAAPSRKR